MRRQMLKQVSMRWDGPWHRRKNGESQVRSVECVFMVDFSHPRRSNGMNQNGKMRQKIGTNPAVSLLKLHLWEFLPVWTSGNLTNLICGSFCPAKKRSTLKRYRHRWKYCPEASPWKYKCYGTKSWENKNCKVFKQRFHHIDDVWKIWHLNLPALSLVVEPVSRVIVVVEPFSLLRCVDTFVTSVKVACNVTSVRWNILTVLRCVYLHHQQSTSSINQSTPSTPSTPSSAPSSSITVFVPHVRNKASIIMAATPKHIFCQNWERKHSNFCHTCVRLGFLSSVLAYDNSEADSPLAEF